MAEIRIPIIVENKGKKTFKDTDNSIKGLNNSFKKLAGVAGIGLSTAAVINFGKQSVKAFMEDQKAASQLAIAVKNLGLSFETPRIEQFISEMSRASGVADDVLRPSMQKLLQTTNSVAKSQDLLNLALEISRGSGVDFSTVVEDLTKAYVGQTRGLNKYKLGLTQAELKAASFADLQAKLTDQFSGANAAYLETYAGKLGLVTVAAGEAQETIGKGLIDAFTILSSESGNINDLTDAMNSFAEGTATAFRNVAVLVSNLDKAMQAGFGLIGVLDRLSGSNLVKIFGGGFGLLGTQGAGSFGGNNAAGMGRQSEHTGRLGYGASDEAKRKKIEADRLKIEKERAALDKKSLDNQKKQNALTKASKTLNLEAINIEAALKGKISETDRLSLFLQKAILEGNATLATQLSDQLDAAIKRNEELRRSLLSTPKAPNPYEDWKIPASVLNYTAERLGVSPEMVISNPSAIPTPIEDSLNELLEAAKAAYDAQIKADQATAASDAVANQSQTIVKVEIDGQEMTRIITDTQVNDSLSGTFSSVNRFGYKGTVGIG
jgi:hypothetical protein